MVGNNLEWMKANWVRKIWHISISYSQNQISTHNIQDQCLRAWLTETSLLCLRYSKNHHSTHRYWRSTSIASWDGSTGQSTWKVSHNVLTQLNQSSCIAVLIVLANMEQSKQRSNEKWRSFKTVDAWRWGVDQWRQGQEWMSQRERTLLNSQWKNGCMRCWRS